MGYVYILKNPSFGDGNEWVKIGRTDQNDVEQRVKQLNQSEATPFGFRIYATYEVESSSLVEKAIHQLIDEIHFDLRSRDEIDGRTRVREFFHITAESAYRILSIIAKLRGDEHNLNLYQPNVEEIEEEYEAESYAISRRGNNSFKMLQIPNGSELTYRLNPAVKCTTIGETNKVLLDDEEYTISALAIKLGRDFLDWDETRTANGFQYFLYENESLSDRRGRLGF